MDLATVDKLLTTTRTVRKRLDLTRPVEPEIIQECLEIATQAPIGRDTARYHFIVVTDPDKRSALADIYRKGYAESVTPQQQEDYQQTNPRFIDSANYLAEHLHEVPALILPCVNVVATPDGGLLNIVPATWSLMLALRARGIGAAWTSVHTHRYAHEAAALLGIPDNIRQAALLPVAYFTGEDFKPAKRVPARERTYWDSWGETR